MPSRIAGILKRTWTDRLIALYCLQLFYKVLKSNDVQVQQFSSPSQVKSAWLCIKSSQVQVRSLKKLTKSSQVHSQKKNILEYSS